MYIFLIYIHKTPSKRCSAIKTQCLKRYSNGTWTLSFPNLLTNAVDFYTGKILPLHCQIFVQTLVGIYWFKE